MTKLEKTKAPTFFKKYQNGMMRKEWILSLGNGQEKTVEKQPNKIVLMHISQYHYHALNSYKKLFYYVQLTLRNVGS